MVPFLHSSQCLLTVRLVSTDQTCRHRRMKVSMFLSLHQSKPDSAELGSPKTTDDIVQEKGEEGRAARRRHKTENVKQQWSQDKTVAVELEQTQRWDSLKPL